MASVFGWLFFISYLEAPMSEQNSGKFLLTSIRDLDGKERDIRIAGDVITEISSGGELEGNQHEDEKVIECRGLQLLPGLVDLHTHLS